MRPDLAAAARTAWPPSGRRSVRGWGRSLSIGFDTRRGEFRGAKKHRKYAFGKGRTQSRNGDFLVQKVCLLDQPHLEAEVGRQPAHVAARAHIEQIVERPHAALGSAREHILVQRVHATLNCSNSPRISAADRRSGADWATTGAAVRTKRRNCRETRIGPHSELASLKRGYLLDGARAMWTSVMPFCTTSPRLVSDGCPGSMAITVLAIVPARCGARQANAMRRAAPSIRIYAKIVG